MASKKGVVMEIGKGWAIILLPDGEFKKIKTHQYLEVGEQYQEAVHQVVKYIAAAVILLTFLLASIDYYSVKSYAQVSSMVELGVNRWGRVISVKATNDHGQQILKNIKVKNDKLEIAIEKINSQDLKDKQDHKKELQKPDLSKNHSRLNNPGQENELHGKLHNDLQDAVQSQKPSNVMEETIKKNVIPQINQTQEHVAIDGYIKIPSINLEQEINTENLEKTENKVEEQVDSLESNLIKQHDQIEQSTQQNGQQLYSELKDKLDNN